MEIEQNENTAQQLAVQGKDYDMQKFMQKFTSAFLAANVTNGDGSCLKSQHQNHQTQNEYKMGTAQSKDLHRPLLFFTVLCYTKSNPNKKVTP